MRYVEIGTSYFQYHQSQHQASRQNLQHVSGDAGGRESECPCPSKRHLGPDPEDRFCYSQHPVSPPGFRRSTGSGKRRRKSRKMMLTFAQFPASSARYPLRENNACNNPQSAAALQSFAQVANADVLKRRRKLIQCWGAHWDASLGLDVMRFEAQCPCWK